MMMMMMITVIIVAVTVKMKKMIIRIILMARKMIMMNVDIYEGVSKRFRTESIMKYTLTMVLLLKSNIKVMAAKLTRLTNKIAIQFYLVAESCTICSSRYRRPVR